MRILGIDPGLQHCGWGVIEIHGNALKYISCGTISSKPKQDLAIRLAEIQSGVEELITLWKPDQFAIEETFVNKNALSSLKLGHARGVAMVAPARQKIPVFEYPTNLVKKSIVGAGHADKSQMMMMVKTLLPGADLQSADAADALAVAICHAHHGSTRNEIQGRM